MIHYKKETTEMRWLEAKAVADQHGGRLMTLQEAQNFITDYLLNPSEAKWAAVSRPDILGGTDWVKVSSVAQKSKLGSSYLDTYDKNPSPNMVSDALLWTSQGKP